jgi:hypothetical protein
MEVEDYRGEVRANIVRGPGRFLMKRVALVVLLLVGVLIFGVVSATADTENVSMVVQNDFKCRWQSGSLHASGRAKYVETSNGKWTLSCHGTISRGDMFGPARQLKSTDRAPRGICSTPFGTTNNWHMVFSPSGKSSFVCHGDLPH